MAGEWPKYDASFPGLPFARNPSKPQVYSAAIYVLLDPHDSTVRYVGKTNDPERRGRRHAKAGPRRSNRPLEEWRVCLKKAGLWPVLVVVHWVPYEDWERAEMDWIAYYASLGRLLNKDAGGVPAWKRGAMAGTMGP